MKTKIKTTAPVASAPRFPLLLRIVFALVGGMVGTLVITAVYDSRTSQPAPEVPRTLGLIHQVSNLLPLPGYRMSFVNVETGGGEFASARVTFRHVTCERYVRLRNMTLTAPEIRIEGEELDRFLLNFSNRAHTNEYALAARWVESLEDAKGK